jgi:hypothetical protein
MLVRPVTGQDFFIAFAAWPAGGRQTATVVLARTCRRGATPVRVGPHGGGAHPSGVHPCAAQSLNSRGPSADPIRPTP